METSIDIYVTPAKTLFYCIQEYYIDLPKFCNLVKPSPSLDVSLLTEHTGVGGDQKMITAERLLMPLGKEVPCVRIRVLSLLRHLCQAT